MSSKKEFAFSIFAAKDLQANPRNGSNLVPEELDLVFT
jgi:hypothetical protein